MTSLNSAHVPSDKLDLISPLCAAATGNPQSAPHVILLDLHMPRRNGLEVLHWVRQNYSDRDVAVCLLTSPEDPARKMQATADGVTAYLIKHALIAICNTQRLDKTGAKQSTLVNEPAEELANFSQEIV